MIEAIDRIKQHPPEEVADAVMRFLDRWYREQDEKARMIGAADRDLAEHGKVHTSHFWLAMALREGREREVNVSYNPQTELYEVQRMRPGKAVDNDPL